MLLGGKSLERIASTLRSDQGILKRERHADDEARASWASTLRSDQGILKPVLGGRQYERQEASTLRSDQGILKLAGSQAHAGRLVRASTLRSDQGILKQDEQAAVQAIETAMPQPYDPTRGY